MILSFASSGLVGPALAACSLAALLAYGVAAWRPEPADGKRRLRGLLILAWLAHLAALVLDIAGLGRARFGFAPALSMTLWLVLGVYLVESRFLPLPGVQRVLAMLAATGVALAWAFPGEARPLAGSPWAPLHWVLGLASYGLFGVAVLHSAMQHRAERQMRRLKASAAADSAPGLPLLRLERLTFQFVAAGVAVLSLALLLGWWFTPQWRWDHKNLLSLLGWAVLSGLLLGRHLLGWRGRRARRWLYAGAGLLLLAYVGSRFVLEVLLQRSGATY